MFNLGWGELMVVFIIVLLVFGAKGIPEIARNLGKSLNAFKRGVRESEEELKKIARDDEPPRETKEDSKN